MGRIEMEKINRKYGTKGIRKLLISLTVGLLGAMAVNVCETAFPEKVEYFVQIQKAPEQMTAWWGTLYPKFCFSEIPEGVEEKDVKISFWLARVLNW